METGLLEMPVRSSGTPSPGIGLSQRAENSSQLQKHLLEKCKINLQSSNKQGYGKFQVFFMEPQITSTKIYEPEDDEIHYIAWCLNSEKILLTVKHV